MSELMVTDPVLGGRHGFSLRTGGVSVGPYTSLNLGAAVGDDPEAVETNLARLAALAGVERFHQVSQVHGRRVVEVRSDTDPLALVLEEADALVTGSPGVAVGIRTADCVPLLMRTPVAVAAVHAGWRGTIARIAAAAVEHLGTLGASPEEVSVTIGPCIGVCCYEVSDELGERFEREVGSETIDPKEGARPHLDLRRANRRILVDAGVPEASIRDLEGCTHHEEDRFFSHRRDAGTTGRHLSWIRLDD